MSHVHVNGVNLDYVEEGAGIPVVFSHGGSSDLRYWEPQRKAFAADHQFVAYSRRFHGPGAQKLSGDNSTEAHVADLVEIIRRLPIRPVHLIGFSTALGLRATLAAPDLVRSLTIIEPNVPWLLEGDAAGRTILAQWRANNERVTAVAAGDAQLAAKLWFELVNNRGPGTFDAQPEGLRRMWLDNFAVERPAAPSPDPLTCEHLGAISPPTLVVGAEYGMSYSRRIVDSLAQCIPAARLLVIPGVTHFMSYQMPSAFNELIMDFLAHHSD